MGDMGIFGVSTSWRRLLRDVGMKNPNAVEDDLLANLEAEGKRFGPASNSAFKWILLHTFEC